jgi:hypothetical protein
VGKMVEGMTLQQVNDLKFGQTVYSIGYYNNDGTAQSFKVQGAHRTWKRNSDRVEVTLKRGMSEYITFNEWCLDEFSLEEPIKKPVKAGK